MKILAFDTTTKYLSIALTDNDRVVSIFHEEVGMNLSAVLLNSIDSVLKKGKTKLAGLDALSVSIGPGSFTGLRIAVATCKAFSLVTGVKIAAVPTMDVIAENYNGPDGFFAPILDARKGMVYSAVYEKKKGVNHPAQEDVPVRRFLRRKSPYLLTDIQGLIKYIKKDTVFFGDGLTLYADSLAEKSRLAKIDRSIDWYPRAEAVARLGLEKIKKHETVAHEKLAPMYLYPKECGVRGYK